MPPGNKDHYIIIKFVNVYKFSINIFVRTSALFVNFKKKFPEGVVEKGTISYTNQIEEALKDANICFIFTEWKEIKKVEPEAIKQLMRTPLVYDGRNIFDPEKMKAAGVEYYSIGR